MFKLRKKKSIRICLDILRDVKEPMTYGFTPAIGFWDSLLYNLLCLVLLN